MKESASGSDRVQIAILGAGVIGSALAMALVEQGAKEVVVYDPDLEGVLSSTELNAGGVRATFNQPANILCSKISIDYFAKHADEVAYRPVGYLWIHGEDALANARQSFARWDAAGWPYEEWDVARLVAYAPFIDRTEGIAGAVFAPRDGLLNPNLLKLHFRNRARAAGARFVDRMILREGKVSSTGVELGFERIDGHPSRESRESVYRSLEDGATPGPIKIHADRVVNCAGAWARDVARILGYECPSHKVRRQISLFDCRDVDLANYGMIVDSSGVYFHPEAGYILGGVAEREEPIGHNFAYGGDDYFQEKVWMPLAERSSKFESLRHLSGWAGLYEVSPDESAIIGEVECGAPGGTGRVYESHSYSGHGIMHSYAAAVALAEKMLSGRSCEIDLDLFSGARFAGGRPLSETAVI